MPADPNASVDNDPAATPDPVESAPTPEEISVDVVRSKKYTYNVDGKDFSLVPVTDAASSGCVLSYTLNVYFDVLSAENAAFEITKIEADVIYGDVSGTDAIVQRSAAVNWV